jgi:hypothetical protein
VQSLAIHVADAWAHVGEWGSVFNPGACETCGTEKDAVGNATSQTLATVPSLVVCAVCRGGWLARVVATPQAFQTMTTIVTSRNNTRFFEDNIS